MKTITKTLIAATFTTTLLPIASAMACDAQHTETGNFFTGTQYKSVETFPQVAPGKAYDALNQYLVKDGGWKFTHTDRENGIIQVVENTANNPTHTIPLNITITPDGKGSTVTLLFTTDPLQQTAVNIEQGMCDMLNAVNPGSQSSTRQ